MTNFSQKSILGIDEAGRGPILGPLVIAGVLTTPEQEETLEKLGIKDSKLFGSSLKAKKTREHLANLIQTTCPTYSITIDSTEVDQYVQAKSLNQLEQEKAKLIIQQIPADKVILDGANLFKPLTNENIEALNKADSKFIAVAAASIIAKTIRDQVYDSLIKPFTKEFGEVKGGGYANLSTLEFVKWYRDKFQKLPDFYRKSYRWKYLE